MKESGPILLFHQALISPFQACRMSSVKDMKLFFQLSNPKDLLFPFPPLIHFLSRFRFSEQKVKKGCGWVTSTFDLETQPKWIQSLPHFNEVRKKKKNNNVNEFLNKLPYHHSHRPGKGCISHIKKVMQIYSEWDLNLKLPSTINLLPAIKDFVTD